MGNWLEKINKIWLIARLIFCYSSKIETYLLKVANTKSAKKRILVAERNRQSNRTYKSTVKTLIKKTIISCENYKKDPNTDNEKLVKESLNQSYSLIDKAVKKNVLHKNNGANKKSRINNLVKMTLKD